MFFCYFTNILCIVGDQERILFVHTTTGFVPGLERIVDRENLYNDVLSMYKEGDIVCEYPLFVKYKGENALDDGGVQRDMFSAFWGDAYINLFEGAKTLVPMVQPGIDIANFSTLGRIISHGYLACGFLPVRIVLPSLISMVLGPSVMIPPSILIESFSEYVSEVERLKIKAALACSLPFSPSVAEDLVNILSRFGCRQIPTYLNLPKLIEDVARYEFCVKPAAALALIHAGIPSNHRLFWQKKSACDVHDLFYAMTVTPTKVLALLELPSANNENESRMFGYLTTMIGNMKTTELSLFLRFVTGASVCIVPKITVEFNGLDGFARRPIAHTCDSVLELPTSYINYDDFYSEFQLILNETMKTFAWRMDAI